MKLITHKYNFHSNITHVFGQVNVLKDVYARPAVYPTFSNIY